jgi:hypothetical protein
MKMATASEFPEFDIIERFLAPMPKFWARIFSIASVVLVISLGVIHTYDQLIALGMEFPAWVAKAMALVSSVAAFLSKLTVDKEKWAGQQ